MKNIKKQYPINIICEELEISRDDKIYNTKITEMNACPYLISALIIFGQKYSMVSLKALSRMIIPKLMMNYKLY